jgi:hypothetical protein
VERAAANPGPPNPWSNHAGSTKPLRGHRIRLRMDDAARRAWPVIATLCLAGCAHAAVQAQTAQGSFDADLAQYHATPTTGILRGIVVDDAIRPVAGAHLSLTLPQGRLRANSTQAGAFGFQGLPPGTYLLHASKRGYSPMQVQVQVTAGDNQPALVRLQLPANPAFNPPSVSVTLFDGFLECSANVPGTPLAVCNYPNGCFPGGVAGVGPCLTNATLTQDTSQTYVGVDGGAPQWVQQVMVWQPATPASTQLQLGAFADTFSDYYNGGGAAALMNATAGPSPLTLNIEAAKLALNHVGTGSTGLNPQVFAGGQALPPACAGTVCPAQAGTAINQDFSIVTVVFYGFTPPPGYQYARDGVPTPPDQ